MENIAPAAAKKLKTTKSTIPKSVGTERKYAVDAETSAAGIGTPTQGTSSAMAVVLKFQKYSRGKNA